MGLRGVTYNQIDHMLLDETDAKTVYSNTDHICESQKKDAKKVSKHYEKEMRGT